MLQRKQFKNYKNRRIVVSKANIKKIKENSVRTTKMDTQEHLKQT